MKLSECVATHYDDYHNVWHLPYTYHNMQSPMVVAYCDNYGTYGHFSYACKGTQEQVAAFQGYDNYNSAYEQPYHHFNISPPVPTVSTPSPDLDMQDLLSIMMEIQKNQELLIDQVAKIDQEESNAITSFETQISQLAASQASTLQDQLSSQPTNPPHNLHHTIQLRTGTVYDSPQLQTAEYEVEDVTHKEELYGAKDTIAGVTSGEKTDRFPHTPIVLIQNRSVSEKTDRQTSPVAVVAKKVGEKVEDLTTGDAKGTTKDEAGIGKGDKGNIKATNAPIVIQLPFPNRVKSSQFLDTGQTAKESSNAELVKEIPLGFFNDRSLFRADSFKLLKYDYG